MIPLTKNQFLLAFAILNVVLLFSYYKLGVNKDDYRNVPEKLHFYMIACASVAYVVNLIHIVIISSGERMSAGFQLAAISYYLLQLFFIPLVRSKQGDLVRLLLGLCVIPHVYIHSLSVGWEQMISAYVLIHVTLNDFLLYGFLHDCPSYYITQ